jgi:Putative lumazine-binding
VRDDLELEAIRSVVLDYLEGMIYGQDERIRRAMHPLCMQAGHYNEQYEFISRDAFIAALKLEPRQKDGTPFVFDIASIDVTGDIAAVKLTDDCFGTSWTDYLTLIKHDGTWQIVMKAFHKHTNVTKIRTDQS